MGSGFSLTNWNSLQGIPLGESPVTHTGFDYSILSSLLWHPKVLQKIGFGVLRRRRIRLPPKGRRTGWRRVPGDAPILQVFVPLSQICHIMVQFYDSDSFNKEYSPEGIGKHRSMDVICLRARHTCLPLEKPT